MVYEKRRDNFVVSTHVERLDIDVIHSFVTRSYWARGIPKELVIRAIENSLCFGLYDDAKQIGFARVITDYTRFAYLLDVFVLEEYRGRGLGTWLTECLMEYLTSFGLRKIMLGTNDAQDFYRKFGFKEIGNPKNCMEMLFEMSWFKKEQKDHRE